MSNTFGDFGGFGGFGDVQATVDAPVAGVEVAGDGVVPVKPVVTRDDDVIGDVPVSQINGLQNGKYQSMHSAREAIMALAPEELQRRKENGLAFRWVKTIVDKIEWTTNKKGRRVLKSPKFLGWLVVTSDTNGTPVPFTDAQLLSYVAAHCPRTGKIGTGDEGLQLRYAIRKNRSSKSGNFPDTMVVTLVPVTKTVTKYHEDKLEAAKVGLYEEDGVTPLLGLKPGAKKDSTADSDYIQKYGWKTPEYEEIFGRKQSSKTQKKDKKSAEAFEILAYMNGLRDESAFA